MSRTRIILFSLLPLLLLLMAAEVVVRVLDLDKPAIRAGTVRVNPENILRPDISLGWSHIPNSTMEHSGHAITINSLGLRSPELTEKQPGEFRILSLGESTTFGTGVAADETYSALIQEFLRKKRGSENVTVINAGVGAYSSFQSLKYLEVRGLRLKPDLILFYHEVNDYLPPTWRDYEFNEIGITKTDKELYDSKLQKLNRAFIHFSGVYRFLSFKYATYKINKLHLQDKKSLTPTIGLPLRRFTGFYPKIEGKEGAEELDESKLGTRVSERERLDILTRLLSITRERGIHLVIIHPSYLETSPHECLLTRFCRDNDVDMFEAHPSLHPEGVPASLMFSDVFHPVAQGHRRLAEGLADFIYEGYLKGSPND